MKCKDKPRLFSWLLIGGTAFSLAAMSACSPTTRQHGNLLKDYQIERVVTGVHTRTDVLRLLGSPTTQAPFDDKTWYYLGQETEKRGILDPEIIEERVVIVKFDEEGVVQSVEDVDTQRLAIPYEQRKTKTHGNDLTVIQQLLGNLGRFNPEEGIQR